MRKLLSARLRPWAGRSPQMLNDSVPHETERIPPVIEEPMHYEWIGRKSGTNADLPVPQNYLETPNQILPSGFLKLAEEARHSEGVDDQPLGMNLVHSQNSGRTGRILIMEIEDSFPESGSEDSGGSRTSPEVITDCNIEKPVIRLGPVGQDIRGLGYTNVMAKPDPVGPYKDRDLSVSRMTDGPAGLVRIRHPEGSYEDRDISVPPVTDGPAGLVRTRRPVGSYEDRDISVPPVTDGPAGLVRTRRPVGSYEDRDISVSPVTDGPAGLVRTRRPVGAEMLPALQDGVRPLAGGLLDQVPNPCVLSSPTGSESAVKNECLHPVITMEGEALRGRICPSVVMKTMEPSKVKFSPEVLTNMSEGSLVSSSVIPDPVIRTGSDNRTNIMKLDRIKEQTDLSAVSPSSDSGVHSVDGEWDCMSTYSGESDSIQSVKTVYGGVCQTDRPVVKLRTMDSKGVMDTLEGQYGDQDSVPSVSTNGHKSDIADMGDFSDEEEGQWEEVEPPKVVHTNVRTEFVVNDHMSFLSTIGHNSDIADMGDFSDEDNEHWDEVETSEDVQTEVRTGGVDSNSCARSELAQKPTVVIPHCMEIHDEEYWTNFRFQAKQAFKLDNVALAASDFPIAVKELVVKSRVTMKDINDRAERQYEEEEEWKMAGKTVKPSFFYNDTDRLEDFSIPVSDWCRKGSPIVDEEPTKTVFGPVTGSEERRNRYKIADSGDSFRDPDARARSELSQAKSAIAMGYTFNGDDGAIGIGGNMTGDAVAGDNEYIRVSMISVDEHRTVQSDFEHDSLGIRDCALPECGTQPMLAAYEDLTVCVRESLPSVTTSCFGLCGLTNQFHHADFEWCVECVKRLLWGFIVSCVVSIVRRGIDVFITGCDVLVSNGARLDGLITPGDAMRLCLWRTEDFKDMLHIVMCDHWTGLIRLDIPWGEDNRPVRATRAAVDTGSIRAGGRFGCWDRPVRSNDWMDVRRMDGGPVGTDVWIKYIGDSLWGYQSTDGGTSQLIIGFPWNDSGTDVEDELPSPVVSPDPIMSPPLAPADSSDPFGRGANYDLDLADVFRDATVLPSLVTPLEDTEATVAGTAATYDPPVEPVGTSSPARDSATEGSFLQLLREPRELLTVTSTASPIGPDTSTPAVTPETVTATRTVPLTSPVMPAGGVPDAMGPDLSREGPFDASDVLPDAGQSPLIRDGMEGCQYRNSCCSIRRLRPSRAIMKYAGTMCD